MDISFLSGDQQCMHGPTHKVASRIYYAGTYIRLDVRIRRNFMNHYHAYIVQAVLANLRTGLDLRTNTSTHFTWSSPRFIPVVLISGLVFAN